MAEMSWSAVRYVVTVSKSELRTDGPDDADITFTVPIEVAAADDFNATVEFMRGRLKATGHTGQILDALKSGAATGVLSALADS